MNNAYTPAKSVAYEHQVQLAAALAMRGHTRLRGAVTAVLSRFDLPIPPSWSARKRAAAITGEIAPTGKPDIDNLAKLGFGRHPQIVTHDDAAIVGVRAVKRYGIAPMMICTIAPVLEQDDSVNHDG